MHPITLTISTGRCGTTLLEKSFKETYQGGSNWISHEYLRQNITNVGVYHRCYSESCQKEMLNKEIVELLEEWKAVSLRGPVVDFGWTMRSLIPYFLDKLGSQFRVIHIHRHPVAVAASLKIKGSYSINNSPQWAIAPDHPRALYPQFKSRWASMTPYEKCLYLWLEVSAYAAEVREKYPELPFLEVRSEDLFRSNESMIEIAKFTGFWKPDVAIKRSRENNSRHIFSLERRPIKGEWISYQKHPELVEFGKNLGYCMDEDYVAALIRKYQLPKGVLPYIRNKTGYWAHREKIGRIMRRIGLRK